MCYINFSFFGNWTVLYCRKKKVLIHISLLFRVILIYLRRYLLRLLIYLLYLHFLRNEQKI